MSFWNTIGLILTMSLFIFVMVFLNKGRQDKFDRTQDLFRFKKISDDGIIELPEGLYRCVVEVEPVNMSLKTIDEQQIVWSQFREMVNALHIPITILVQSRHKDIKSYVSNLHESAKNMPTEQLKTFGYELANYLESEISEKRVKDHRYYVVLEVNPNQRQSELDIPNEALASIAAGFQKKLSYQEAEDLARQELMDNVGIIASYLKNMGLNVYFLNKNAVLEMSYSALNRDLAPVTDFNSIVHSSSIHTTSLTLEAIKNEEQEKTA